MGRVSANQSSEERSMTQPQTVSQAVATQETGPAALVRKYEGDFTDSLPSHINPKQWMAVAHGALRRDPNVRKAAENNPGAFLSALLTAARLGLEPDSEQFYLVPQGNEIMGVVGWQGLVELIYRAGAVSSVIVEVVYDKDEFDYQPGVHERPVHKIDWDAEDRGPLRLAYAYAIMKDGATSKVVVMNRADITRIKQSSKSAKSEYSPWNKHEAAMWAKSCVRQLAKYVPTSSEYRREQLRAVQEVAAERERGPIVNPHTGEVINETEVLDGELVD
jgi:recombination protein RecT